MQNSLSYILTLCCLLFASGVVLTGCDSDVEADEAALARARYYEDCLRYTTRFTPRGTSAFGPFRPTATGNQGLLPPGQFSLVERTTFPNGRGGFEVGSQSKCESSPTVYDFRADNSLTQTSNGGFSSLDASFSYTRWSYIAPDSAGDSPIRILFETEDRSGRLVLSLDSVGTEVIQLQDSTRAFIFWRLAP